MKRLGRTATVPGSRAATAISAAEPNGPETATRLLALVVLGACLASSAGLQASGRASTPSKSSAPSETDPHATPAEAKPGRVIIEPPITDADKPSGVTRAVAPAAGGRPAGHQPSGQASPGLPMSELARRINRIVQEQSRRDAATASGSRAAPARPLAARTAKRRLTWDPPVPPAAVRLVWDYDLDPRYAGRAVPSGVRLTWREELR